MCASQKNSDVTPEIMDAKTSAQQEVANTITQCSLYLIEVYNKKQIYHHS